MVSRERSCSSGNLEGPSGTKDSVKVEDLSYIEEGSTRAELITLFHHPNLLTGLSCLIGITHLPSFSQIRTGTESDSSRKRLVFQSLLTFPHCIRDSLVYLDREREGEGRGSTGVDHLPLETPTLSQPLPSLVVWFTETISLPPRPGTHDKNRFEEDPWSRVVETKW